MGKKRGLKGREAQTSDKKRVKKRICRQETKVRGRGKTASLREIGDDQDLFKIQTQRGRNEWAGEGGSGAERTSQSPRTNVGCLEQHKKKNQRKWGKKMTGPPKVWNPEYVYLQEKQKKAR